MPKIELDQLKKNTKAYTRLLWEIAVLESPYLKTPWIDLVNMNNHLYHWVLKNPRGIKCFESCWDDAEKLLPDNGQPPINGSAFHKAVAKALANDRNNLMRSFLDWFDARFPIAFCNSASYNEAATPKFVEEAMKGAGRNALKALIHTTIDDTISSASNADNIYGRLVQTAAAPKSPFFQAVLDVCQKSGGTAAAALSEKYAQKKQDQPDDSEAMDWKAFHEKIQKSLMIAANRLAGFAEGAHDSWKFFDELNKDQWFVSFFMPDLPDESIFTNAKKHTDELKRLIQRRDYATNVPKFESFLKFTEDRVKNASMEITKHRDALEGRTTKIIAGLEVTRDVSFEVLKLAAKAKFGAAGAPIIDGLADGLKKGAEELGKAIAGTSGGVGDAFANIGKEAAISAVLSYVCRDGGRAKQFMDAVAGKVAPTLAKGFFKKVSAETIKKFLTSYALANLQELFKISVEVLSGKMSESEAKQKLGEAIWKKLAVSRFGDSIDDKFHAQTFKLLENSLLKGVSEDVFKKAVEGHASAALDALVMKVIETATADMSVEQLKKKLVELMQKDSNFRRILDQLPRNQ